jgi:colicin import membrane protein
MSEEKKESKTDVKSTDDSSSEKTSIEEPKVDSNAAEKTIEKVEASTKTTEASAKEVEEAKVAEDAIAKAEAAAKAAEEAEDAVKTALAKAKAAKAEAEAAAEEEYKAIAAEVKADATKKDDFTFKRQGEEIFRREMGEPEFFLDKKDRFPRPILSQDEQESLTRQAEIPQDQTPAYIPEHVLSPEFGGVSNYERGVDSFLEEVKLKLKKLKNNPESSQKEIRDAENQIIYLESLHENFYIGMNVFRTAKGGRDKVKA